MALTSFNCLILNFRIEFDLEQDISFKVTHLMLYATWRQSTSDERVAGRERVSFAANAWRRELFHIFHFFQWFMEVVHGIINPIS